MSARSEVPSTPPPPLTPRVFPSHLSRLPSTPRSAGLVEIRSRHALQTSTPLTISHFATSIAELTSSREIDKRTGVERDRLEKIEQFRTEWMIGALSRVRPLELLEEGESETYSDGTRNSLGGTSCESSQEIDPSSPTTTTRSQVRRPNYLAQMPLDAVSRGIIAEQTIKRELKSEGVLLQHKDYASIARVTRKAMKKTIQLGKPVYVSTGLLHSVDWTNEYRQRGFAAPGIRWGPFRPDLVKFEVLPRKDSEDGEPEVSWEVVEVKYAGKNRDIIYTNYKVQAIYYHLTLLRLLSNIPFLVPSHKVTFFISHDPLSAQYLEKSASVRTNQAFVEHHLFVLLPEWLRAVTETEWKRLQDKLAEKPSSPGGQPGTPPTFLEKLLASQRKLPPSTFQPRPNRSTPRTPLSRAHGVPPSASPSSPSKVPLVATTRDSSDEEDSFRSAPSSPLLSHSTGDSNTLAESEELPPLPPVDDKEEQELSDLFDAIGFD
ncbi:uncharacterized protein JCM6883_004752 [Sporobolomyces salmoneus]|uniref:uncharacterized protein n=1 Tax=Sporobolomyces salmoneus TaxID=183962 RepID=UPI00316E15A5